MSAHKAVFWDFGGVISESPFDAFIRYETQKGLPTGFIRTVNTYNPDDNAWAKLERDEITPSQFDEHFAEESAARGHRVPGADILALLSGALRPQMVQALHQLKGHMKIACLTNNVRRSKNPDASHKAVMDLFDFIVESSKVGVRKPEPRFYTLACEALDVAPEEVVYLDDLGINLKPARAMGMHTIKVTDPDLALGELESVLGVALR